MLLGAASQTPTPTYGVEQRRLRTAAEELRDTLGHEQYEALHTWGRRLRRPDAEALALEAVGQLM